MELDVTVAGMDVLRVMLVHLPDQGRQNIEQEIAQCADDNELKELGIHYITSVFRPMKAAGGKTPQPSPSPIVVDETQEPPPSQLRLFTKALEELCLPRDGYRCVATGLRSLQTPNNLLPAGFNRQNTQKTETCHIIPLSMAQHGDSDQARRDASRTWTSLCRMFPRLRDLIADHLENINDSSNLLTLCGFVHHSFGQFDLAFEQQAGQHTYKVITWKGVGAIRPFLPQNNIIQFTDHSNGTTPMPNPYLLQVHLTIANILHASGLAETLDQYFEDYDSLRGLAGDGSTSLPFLIEVP